MKVALPVKGRLREPSFHLLEDAGLGPEQPGDRALAFPCRNAPVEVLLVRAADIPEYVQDGVVDCGITGIDLVRERGADVHELLTLGFGSCRLEAAVPAESDVQTLEELAGSTVATVYPHLTKQLLPAEVTLVDVTGSVEIAPRLGLADAIVDLVSSGNTLRTNGLRSLGVLLESEAVLDRGRRRARSAVRGDASRGRRGAQPPLSDAERARDGAARDRGARRAARPERPAARRGGNGRRARARPERRGLAAAARSSRRWAARRS